MILKHALFTSGAKFKVLGVSVIPVTVLLPRERPIENSVAGALGVKMQIGIEVVPIPTFGI